MHYVLFILRAAMISTARQNSYYIGMREKQAVRSGYGVTFYAGFYACFAALKRNGSDSTGA